ncbi:hypothetical protein ACWIUA_00375 [Ursidibacter sp. B-7004-1]
MKSIYLVELDALPEIDKKITAFINRANRYSWGGLPYPVAIEHNGVRYRQVTCEGLKELQDFDYWIAKKGYRNLLGEGETKAGFFSIFVADDEPDV